MVKIGIITTIPYMDYEKKFDNIKILEYVEKTYNEYIEKLNFKKSDIVLVSNGYPWINHLPISIFLNNEENVEINEKYSGIELCMPSDINNKTEQFVNTHEGRSLNNLHSKYKEKTLIDTLKDLSKISKEKEKQKNKKIKIKRGFKQANTFMVRNCDCILVFGILEKPEEYELWNKIMCNKQYYNIKDFFN
jgi:hypothetical protein